MLSNALSLILGYFRVMSVIIISPSLSDTNEFYMYVWIACQFQLNFLSELDDDE